jgi:hypothetical protein
VRLNFERDGAEIISGAVSASAIDRLLPAFGTGERHRPGSRSLRLPGEVRQPVDPSGEMGALAQRFRPGSTPVRPVRIAQFDKTEATNWGVLCARSPATNLVVFSERTGRDQIEVLRDHGVVDWNSVSFPS